MSPLVELKDRGEEIRNRLIETGLFRDPGHYKPSTEVGRISYGQGYPITAVEKFLGYFDRQNNIANFPSISFNTDFSFARASCTYIQQPGEDSVVLDGVEDPKYKSRADKAINYFKAMYGIKGSFKFYVKRYRKYKNAKGLGESAAVASATARAIIDNTFPKEASQDDVFVSRLARLVSGSGTRSSMDGFSLWLSYPWIREDQCHGVRLPVDTKKFHIMAYPAEHDVSTASAHDMAVSSPFYPRWMINKFQKILEILDSNFDLDLIMQHAEHDMFFMHSVLMAKGEIIHTPESLDLINAVRKFRQKSGRIYFTADTGPSIVLMSDDDKNLEEFEDSYGKKGLRGKVVTKHSNEIDPEFRKESEEYLSR